LLFFGNKLDTKTKQPLFNKAACSKANNILTEILQSFYSDPPDITFYKFKLDKKGDVRKDKRGLELIECSRGANSVESYHKHVISKFGSLNIGPEFATKILAERRHRHNHKSLNAEG
jgi:hypothetical protein